MKHFLIAAKMGDDGSIEQLKQGYKQGRVSKADIELALRAHHEAVDSRNSQQRDEVVEMLQ